MAIPVIEGLAMSAMVSTVVLVTAAIVVAVVVIFLFYGHPRPWWTHRSFDVDSYASDDLYPRVVACLRDVLVLKAASGKLSAAATLSVSQTGVVSVTTSGRATVPSACAAMYERLELAMPALAGVDVASLASFTENHFLTGVVDLANDVSIRNSRAHPVALAIVQCGEGGPDVVNEISRSMAGFLLACGGSDHATVRQGLSDSGLASRARAFLASASPKRTDPYVAQFAISIRGAPQTAEDVMARALTSVADLALLKRHAFPQVRTMRFARRPNLDVSQVVWLFAMPYMDRYLVNISRALTTAKRNSQTAFGKATGLYDQLFTAARKMALGFEYEEPFANPITEAPKLLQGVRSVLEGDGVGVYVDSDGRVRTSEAFVGTIKKIVKAIQAALKLLEQIGVIIPQVVKFVGASAKYIPKLFNRIIDIVTNVQKVGIVGTLIQLIKAGVGAVAMTWLIIMRIQFTVVAWLAHVFFIPWTSFVYQSVALCFGLGLSFSMAVSDVASGGVLRYMARNEDHPEAWWTSDHAEDGNTCQRMVGSLLPCAKGYSPSATGLSCSARSRCRAGACPSVTLVRGYRRGAFRTLAGVATMQRLLPNDSNDACAKESRAQTIACAQLVRGGLRTNGVSLDEDAVTALMRAICLCRGRVLPSGPPGLADDLARKALEHDPLRALLCSESTGAASLDDSMTVLGAKMPGVLVAAVTLACVALAFARTDQLARMLL